MKNWKKQLGKWALFALAVMAMLLIEVPKNTGSASAQNTDTLFEFYGRECHPCQTMKPVVDSLEKNEHIKIMRFEVWHSPENERTRRKYDSLFCGGVPFFINTKTGKWICGPASYQALKD